MYKLDFRAMSGLRLYLASASPRRLLLLRGLGLSPCVVAPRIDEQARAGEVPREMVLRLARDKARSVAGKVARGGHGVVLAADTTVVVDGRALGKPVDAEQATRMLRRLCGRGHDVLTGVYLLRTDDGRETGGVESTRVVFSAYDAATIADYVATGESLDKAGAYGIQGHGATLVEGIEGSWSNVVGLPIERLPGWLAPLDLTLEELSGRP